MTATAARAGTDYLDFVNREIFAFNQSFYAVVLDPLSLAYNKRVPPPLRRGISNFLANIREPLTALSSGLQGKFYNAGDATARFAINSTIGIVGIFDIATQWHIVSRPEDFGQVLCHYDLPEGPFLVIPFFGPATSRDAVGMVGTIGVLSVAIGGLTVPYLAADGSVEYFNADGSAKHLIVASAGSYEAARNAYLARRDASCRDEPDIITDSGRFRAGIGRDRVTFA
jgi:phospholipid-binding lipoprotein MlaA